MHQREFITWIIETSDGDKAMSPGFDELYFDTPIIIDGHDACGLVLMGGEL